MSKHTPGPWVVGNTDPLLFGKQRGQGTEPIGFVYGPSFPERSDLGKEAIANARLIAAAPELLEALKNLLESHLAGNVIGADVREAQEAIAKATGEKQ